MTTNPFLARVIAAALAAGLATAGAQTVSAPDKADPVPTESTMSKEDPNATAWTAGEFFSKAGSNGAAEVELGKLAQAKAQSPEVKEFAAMMVDDHSKANTQLADLGKSLGVQVPTTPDAVKQDESKKLAAQTGASFDRAYVTKMVTAHHDAIKLFEEAAASGDPRTREFAKATLPTLRTHAQHAESLSQKFQ
jgi:putative membrane protein